MKTDRLDLRQMDCMDLMAEFPDNHFDLAIVDPPYGIGADKAQNESGARKVRKDGKVVNGWGWKYYKHTNWDESAPGSNYFEELRRVSKHQIVWGGKLYVAQLTTVNGLDILG
jgi:site-specific DNA-methyltransferase (adenine-specific)